jgi:hypothetical protein
VRKLIASDDEDFAGIDWTEWSKQEKVKFFAFKYSHTSFLHCIFYMDGYLALEKSSELGQFFCKSKL